MRKLTRILIGFILLIFVISGCLSYSRIADISGVQEDYLYDIPNGAKTVLVEKANVSADSLYEEVHEILLLRGHKIIENDRERHVLSTQGMNLALSIVQRMRIVIIDNLDVSQMSITTEWKKGTDPAAVDQAMSGIPIEVDWVQAKWEISSLGIAFAESVAVAREIKNGYISFK